MRYCAAFTCFDPSDKKGLSSISATMIWSYLSPGATCNRRSGYKNATAGVLVQHLTTATSFAGTSWLCETHLARSGRRRRAHCAWSEIISLYRANPVYMGICSIDAKLQRHCIDILK